MTGVSASIITSGAAALDVNLHGAVTATSISDTASTVTGIAAGQSGLATLRLTADGAVTATASSAGSTATGISVGATEVPGFLANPNTYIVRANGDVTATSDGAATGISVTRGTGNFVTAGSGGADLVSKGTVTATSTSAAAIGVRGVFANDATNAATLSLRTEGNVIANGTAAGSYGILAQRGGTGDLKIDVLAGVQSTGTGIAATRTTAGNIFITAGSNAAISGVTGVTTSGGTTTLVNYGSITGTGGTAVQFGGTNDVLQMAPSGTFNGNVVGNGTSILQLGGTTAANVNLAQFSGFSNIASLAGSNWSFVGNSNFAGTFNVDGAFTFNGDMSSASVIVGANGTLGGNGTYGSLVVNGTLSPGNSPGTITTASLTMTAASTYLVQVTAVISDRTIVTGTANIAGRVVVDPLERLIKKTTYTILTAGTLNGTFASTNLLLANNLARNPVLSYVGNDVLLTLDPGLLSPILPAQCLGQQQECRRCDRHRLARRRQPLQRVQRDLQPVGQQSAERPDPDLRRDGDRHAADHVQRDEPVHGAFCSIPSSTDAAIPPAQAARRIPMRKGASPMPRARKAAARASARPMPRCMPRRRSRRPTIRAGACGQPAYGGSQTTERQHCVGSNNTTSRLFGTAVGADYRFSPNTIAGFALAGGGTNFSVNGGGSGRSDLFQAGAFVRHNIGPAYIAGALAYGWQDVTTDRTVTVAGIDRLRAGFNANAFSGRIEGGYRFVAPWIGGVGLTPYAAGQFTTFELPAYAEQVVAGANTFALAYNSKSVTNTRSELGLRADKSFALTNAVLTLRGRAAWAHDFNPDRTIAATFQALPGASFIVNGAAQAQNSALTTASAEVKWMNGWSAAGSFEGEFSSVTRSYAGKGVVRYAW